MAQLRDSTIDGNVSVTGNVILKTSNKGVQGIHPETNVATRLIHLSNYGDTLIGYDGYKNQNGNSHICGNDIMHYISSVGEVAYRPYYKAGDSIDFVVKTAGFITNSGKAVAFTIPLSMPIIGSPTARVTTDNGFILRQDGNYTHGSDGAAGTYVKATSFSIEDNYNGGFVVTAIFNMDTGSVVNNSHIGIAWTGTITLS